VHPLDEHIGSHDSAAVRTGDDGRIVARPEQHSVRRAQARGDASDEPELA
jgi:hypothetical protein